ncbi:hypothetical protein [Crossiella cryophila]|uniref:DUF4280 domain-containing protein n=1 Tax=Crossiella cryophila TaxID=43355 RepID=A0A7W7CDQ3_9PSEU|nr:hypothetical protein [Crossiella cryophila]MBB4677913.1 hypothetical protein [Crossiella cryophila]
MPGLLFHAGAVLTCGHAGRAEVTNPGQIRVRVNGQPVATSAARIMVTGCPIVPPPPPCTMVDWKGVAVRVRAMGAPVLLQPTPAGPGPAICNGPPPVNPLVLSVQARVRGL